MHGQGSPYTVLLLGRALFRHWFSSASCCALVCAYLLLATQAATAEDEVSVGVRITWGGGVQPQLWQGSIRVDRGTLLRPRRLGYEVDLPGTMQVGPSAILFEQRTATNFDGIDVLVRASEQAMLTIELMPAGRPDLARTLPLVDLDKLAEHDGTVFLDEELAGDQQSRLQVRRIPGDQLRVEFDRNSLVFSPGEQFTFELTPNRLALPPGTSLRCIINLEDTAGKELPWSEVHELRVNEQRGTQVVPPITVDLPRTDGAYSVVVSCYQKPRFDFIPTRPKLLMQRRVQLVVIGSESPVEEAGPWIEVGTIELGNPRWWEQWRRLSELFKGGSDGRWGEPLTERKHQGQDLLQLAAGKYQAAPIPISRIGAPHILEIEYPSDLPQTLGISILQPNAEGAVTPLQLDSGIDVRPVSGRDPFQMQRHRLVFWPRSKTPVLLLTNRLEDAPAAFGKIRVLSGPQRLPVAEVAAQPPQGRLLAVYYDKPLFPENFSAPEALDPWTNNSLRDWTTFFEGGRRLVEYLKYAGYNGAIVSVAREGSALYPSKLLEPTPRYDNGTFFFTGQDPLQKDVLELLFRLFDREGVTLVPALHFSTPLPELERMLMHGGSETVGLEPLDGSAKPWRAPEAATRRGRGPHYNPLDPRVQQAVGRVIDELAARYAHHPSFGGLALQIAPDTFVQLPGEGWGFDDRTVSRFERDTKSQVPIGGAERYAKYLLGPAREKWLQWRADQLTGMQQDLQQRIARRKPTAKLFLVTGEMVKSWSVQHEMRPRLLGQTRFAEAMLVHGLDSRATQNRSQIVPLRPQRLSPVTSLVAQAVNIELNRSFEVDRFHRGAGGGVLGFHEPLTLTLPAFDAESPFPRGKITTWITAHIPPSGARNRARFAHSLATLDATVLADGGWMIPLGQEDAVKDLFAVYRQLPSQPFETAEPVSPSAQDSGIVVRTLAHFGRTYVYIVNDSPWAAQVDVELAAPANCRVRSLDSRNLPALVRLGQGFSWEVKLQPYDLVGAVLTAPRVKIKDWRVRFAEEVEAELRDAVQGVKSRVFQLENPTPIDLLQNADFEAPPTTADPVPGWSFDRRPGVLVEVVKRAAGQGRQSLHFRNEDPMKEAWMRSHRFPLPKTGRIAVFVSIRTADVSDQPALRVAFDLEGPHNQNHYLFTPLGRDPSGRPAPQLSQDWPAEPWKIGNNELPVSDATSVCIGFDLIGKGEVWIDDVQVFDLHFDRDEHDKLLQKYYAAFYNWEARRFADCYHSLDGYWPRFLLEFVPEPPPRRVAQLPATVPRRSVVPRPESAPRPEKKPSFLNRIFDKIKDPF